jgi:hypothetical protein
MIKSILFSVACILSAIALHYSSDYMQYKDVPVTFVDRHLDESCSKSNCRDRFVGLFKTNEGFVLRGKEMPDTIKIGSTTYTYDEVYSISGLVQEDFLHDPIGCAEDFTECLQCLMILEGKE